MKSLIGYVGIQKPMINQPSPPSGMFINALGGITTDMIDKIAEREQATFEKVWTDIQSVAAVRIQSDIVAKMMERFDLHTSGDLVDIAADVDPDGAVRVAADEWRGIRFAFRRKRATFETFMIGSVWIYATGVRMVTVRILNRQRNVIKELPEMQTVEGWNEIIIDEAFPEDELFIVASTATGGTIDSAIPGVAKSCFCQTVQACCNTTGADVHGVIVSNEGVVTSTGTNVHGMRVTGQLTCDHAAIVYHSRKLFLPAWLFLLGNQTAIEVLSSSRVNQHTTVDRDQYVELRDHYQIEYEKALGTIVAGMRVSDSCCIKCKPDTKRVSWKP